MRPRMVLAQVLLMALVTSPVLGQSEPSPSPSPGPSVIPPAPAAPSAEPAPALAEPAPMTAAEVASALLDTVNGKHRKGSYEAVSKDVLRYYRKHPEAVFAPKRYAREFAPRRVLPACGNARGRDREDACAAAAGDLFYAYLATRDETVLELIDRFLGATSRFIPKSVDRQRVSGLAPIVISENAKLLRVPVDLPPVTDEEHVTVVVVDPGPFPKQFAKSIEFYAEVYGQEIPKRFPELPAIVLADVDLATARQVVRFFGGGGVTLGITDAPLATELFGRPGPPPEPSAAPSIAPNDA